VAGCAAAGEGSAAREGERVSDGSEFVEVDKSPIEGWSTVRESRVEVTNQWMLFGVSRKRLRWMLIRRPWLTIKLPFSWLRYSAPLIGCQWRDDRRWLGGIRCAECGQIRVEPGEPDPCLGRLEGVAAACCGHGQRRYAYIWFKDGPTIRGFDVIEPKP
jgi:hypothetical protein